MAAWAAVQGLAASARAVAVVAADDILGRRQPPRRRPLQLKGWRRRWRRPWWRQRGLQRDTAVDLYKIFVHSIAFLYWSIILLLPPPSALLTLLQYYCTTIAQHTTPHPTGVAVEAGRMS